MFRWYVRALQELLFFFCYLWFYTKNDGEKWIFTWLLIFWKNSLHLLSPFIFILCMEALGSLLNHAENQEKITGMRVTRACPSVSHLLFADDSLFFCKAEPHECEEVMDVVRRYGKALGQCINFDKSNPLYSLVKGSTQMIDSRWKILLAFRMKEGWERT